jgi:hypothetical protein
MALIAKTTLSSGLPLNACVAALSMVVDPPDIVTRVRLPKTVGAVTTIPWRAGPDGFPLEVYTSPPTQRPILLTWEVTATTSDGQELESDFISMLMTKR